MRKYYLFIIILLSIPISALAQKRAFTIEDFYRLKSISDIHVSPDERSVVYSMTSSDLPRAKRSTHIWMMDIDGKNAHQLTSSDKSESSSVFSPDGKWISYISSKDGSP